MHKETVNTFTKGMVKDTHPLTTPADVLTDCLNGTLITYNGNEMILQNDMGNVLIGSAELPAGYIPVGITEYGGIIYVASYNPLTGKSQIGSFPSPQQRHMSEIWSLASEQPLIVTLIDLSSFYNGNDIVSTEIRQPLSQNASGQNMYKLYPGDKFKVQKMTGTESAGPIALDSSIEPYVEMLLGIIKKDGTIEIINDLNYLDGNEHVYTGKSSGYPILIIKLKTIKSFNLSRTYSRGTPVTENEETHDTVNITFRGSVEEEVPGCFTGLGGQIQTPGEADALDGTTASITESNLTMEGLCNYSIYPALVQGNMTSMRKTGVIDLSKFRDNRKEITAWSYLVLDNYVKVNWSFDYYSLDDSIDKVVFEVYNLLNPDPIFEIEIIQDSYNGSFELIINFDNLFKKNDIYIVRIMGYAGQAEGQKLGSRMIYTSGIFNDYYGRVTDFTNVGFAAAAPEAMNEQHTAFLDTIKCKLTATVTPIDVTYEEETEQNPINTITVTGPDGLSENYRGLKNLTSNCFTARTESTGTGYFTVSINRKYKFEVALKLDVDEPKYGFVSDKTKEKILESYQLSVLEFVNKNIKQGTISVIPPIDGQDPDSFTVTLADYNPTGEVILPAEDEEEDPSVLKLKFEKVNGTYTPLSLSTLMRVKCSAVKSTIIRRTALRPLYYPDLSMAEKDKVLTCWNIESPRMCCGADENNIHYNSTLAAGTVVQGTDAGAGRDDTGLNTAMEQMNLPMVSMFAGVDGDQASYSPDDTVYDPAGHLFLRNTINGWGCSDNEIDDTDNWLITTWKQSDNHYRFLNLASRRTEKTKGEILARLDVMLRCLLSLILTTQMFTDNVRYVTTSASDLGYYDTCASVLVNLQQSDQVDYDNVEYKEGHFTLNDIIYGEDAIYELINAKSEIIDLNTEILNIKYVYTIEEDAPAVDFGQEFATSEIASMFTGAEYSIDESLLNDGSNSKLIYVIDWSKVSNQGGSSIYNVRSDGTYEWRITDLTRIAKISGYADGTSFDASIPDFSPTNPNSPCYAGTLSADNSDTLKMSWYNNSDWYFYNSFNHTFMTYCRWMDEDVSENQYNEIVINRDTGHIGADNACGMWRKKKDDDAPDIIAALSNRLNSIYRRYTWQNTFPNPAF